MSSHHAARKFEMIDRSEQGGGVLRTNQIKNSLRIQVFNQMEELFITSMHYGYIIYIYTWNLFVIYFGA